MAFQNDSTPTPTKTHWIRGQSVGRVLERISELENLKIFKQEEQFDAKFHWNVYTLKLPIQ